MITITTEIQEAWAKHLDEIVDHDMRGQPIPRRALTGSLNLIEFAAGFQAAKKSYDATCTDTNDKSDDINKILEHIKR